MKIVEMPNSILHKKSQVVSLPLSHEDEKIAQKLISYLKTANAPGSELRSGVGIAAVQLGYLKRMFYVWLQNEKHETVFEDLLINPQLSNMRMKAALEKGEGCLSVPESLPNQEGLVHRYKSITAQGYSYFKKKNVSYELSDLLAIIFQHEMDHLNGKLFFERIDSKKPNKQLPDETLI